ncbi:MAG: PIN domain-containing protein [Geminicoccaceae bacterium]|nr:PIN domain-containing protein [Geminicoccaceae bacterium]
MFANRYTAFVDACSLAKVLPRNLLLTLAEAEFFRVRWSAPVLAETERAIAAILLGKDRAAADASAIAAEQVERMRRAFDDAEVTGFDDFRSICKDLPDPGDVHIVAAALKTRAATIVTENLKHFPERLLVPLDIEVRTSDAFIADTIALDPGRAVAAIRRMRERFKRPEKTAGALLLDMEATGLTTSVDILRSFRELL